MQPTHDLRYADDGLRNSKISVSGIYRTSRLLILLLRFPNCEDVGSVLVPRFSTTEERTQA